MRAMVLETLGPLDRRFAAAPTGGSSRSRPGHGELLIEVQTCGVCHTELDEIEGRMPPPRLPIVLGHQVVGRVAALGRGSARSGRAIASASPGSSPPAGVRILPERRGEPLRALPRDRSRRPRRLCRADDRARGVRASHPRARSRMPRPPRSLRRRDRLPVVAVDRPEGRPEPGADRLRRLGAPGPQDGAPPLSPHAGLRLRPRGGGAGVRPGTRCGLGRRHRRRVPRAAARDHRHDARPGPRSSRPSRTSSRAGGW